jgi:L-glutamine-phosphate cytidylyltransferase
MRAILLAAGMGTRLRPLTNDTPKSLVKVNGVPMLEKQIQCLKEKGIHEIIVLTGYLKEKFEYLREKYDVKLVHNDKYDIYNNIYTMYLVREYLNDAYVIEGDVYFNRNFLDVHLNTSVYFSAKKMDFKDEWMLVFDEDKKIHDIEIGTKPSAYILCGISYWNEKDGRFIGKKVEEAIESGDFKDLYWDNIVKDNLINLEVYLRELQEDDSFEIDSLDDLNKVEQRLKALR